MMIITPEQEVKECAEVLRGLKLSIAALRREFEDLLEKAQSGKEIKQTAVSKCVSEAKTMLASCVRAEIDLNDCRNKQAGIAQGGYALDLDAARADIGCKLDRLRRCADPGPVS